MRVFSTPKQITPTGAKVARIVLQIDPTLDPDRARRTFDSHLARAKWVARHGYRHLLSRGWPKSE